MREYIALQITNVDHSLVLAKTSKPAEPSPAPSAPRRHSRSILQDRDELSPVLDRPPRLSMALGDLDDDSFHENPPRLSHNWDQEDDTFENPRRAMLNARDRRSLGGFGDLSFQDLNELGMEDQDEREARQRLAMEEEEMMGEDEVEDDMDELDMDGETGELRELMENRRQSGRSEDIGPSSSPGTTGEPTFLFRIPERTRNSLLRPTREQQDEVEDEIAARANDEEAGAQFEDDGYEDIYDDREAAAPLRGDSPTLEEAQPQTNANKSATRARKELKVSRYGLEYPSLPPTVIKRLASTFARSYGGTGKLNKETLTAISQTSDWFFEQISEDLTSYADHAGRKTIEESDVVTLMKRYVIPFFAYMYIHELDR
jgi:histone H3/H4